MPDQRLRTPLTLDPYKEWLIRDATGHLVADCGTDEMPNAMCKAWAHQIVTAVNGEAETPR